MEGGGRARRRRKRKGRGGGSAGEPQGRSEAEGDTARGEEGIGGAVQVTPRDGVKSNAGGGGGPGGRREGHNGEAERERLRLGGLGSRQGGRNGGVEQERFGLGGLGVQPLQLAGGSGGRRGRRRRGGSAAGEPHDKLGVEDEMAGDAAGDEQAMGRRYGDAAREGGAELISGGRRNGEPTPPLAEDSAVAMEGGRKARAAVEVHLSSRTGGATSRVTRSAATEAKLYRQRCVTAWNPMLEVVEDLTFAGKGTTARPSGKGSALEVPGQGATVALSSKGSALDEHDAGGYDGCQGSGGAAAGDPHGMLGAGDEMAGKDGHAPGESWNVSDGGGLPSHLAGHNGNTEHNKRRGLVGKKMRNNGRVASTDRPSMLRHESNFLCDSLLSWTIKDVLNPHLYEKMVQKNPSKYDSVVQFVDLHRVLLLEETRSALCSSISNSAELQYCPLLSVEPCESPCLFYLDIDLDMSSSETFQCHHIAQDYDVCLLSSQPLINSSIDEMCCSLSIAVGIGQDTSYQKSFRVIVNYENFQPEKMKYVSFLPNIRFSKEIGHILSDEKDHRAVEAVLQLYKMVGKKCDSCIELSKGDMQPAVSQKYPPNFRCLHKNQTDVVWAPPGTLKEGVAAVLEKFHSLKPKVLICAPSVSSVAEIIVNLEELSISPDTGDVIVINNLSGQENCNRYEKFNLQYQSQELYCCLTQCEGSLRGMRTLLNLQAYYHTHCINVSSFCTRCSKSKLLKFSLNSIARRFDAIIEPLEKSLLYLKNHATSFSLLDQDITRFEELMDNLKEIEMLFNNENLRVHYVEKDSLIPAVDGASGSRTHTLAESLNERRIRSMTLIDEILDSLHLPQAEDRDMLDRLCIKNSRIVVITLDCTWQLHGVEMDPFDLMVIHGAGQIREDELLVPLLLPVGHTLLFGDHLHLEPVIRSKICKEAGYGVSIFEKLQRLVSRKQMLRSQYAMHPFIHQFPNAYFYKGKVSDGPNVRSIDYNREFIPLKLPHYSFIDIPATKMRPIKKGYVYSAAILGLLQQFCEDMMNTNRKFNIAVVCMSTTESNTVRDHLRSKKEIHEKIRLQVTSVDSLKEESFDVIILSMLLEDGTELKCVKENSFNVALTSSRYCLWIVGEQKVLRNRGGIWKSLICDADRRGFVEKVDKDVLVEATKQFEMNDNGCCTNPNSAVSLKTACLPGQELTWNGRPFRTKYILATVRDQRGQTDTCTLQAILGAMESIMKFRNAGLEPPQEFKWDFILDDLKMKYEKAVSKAFRSEDKADRGTKLLENLFEILQKHGAVAINESRTKWRAFKILGWEHVDPTDTKAVKKILEQGGIMVGHFRVSKNYYNLKPGEVYVFDEDQALLNPRSDQPASHAVMMIGIGHGKNVHNGPFHHMAMQNSEGRIFGFNGIGRVDKNTVRGLYQIKLPDMKRKARGGA